MTKVNISQTTFISSQCPPIPAHTPSLIVLRLLRRSWVVVCYWYLSQHALYVRACQQDDRDFEEIWDFVRSVTNIYPSELQWKKAVILYGIMKDHILEDGAGLLAACTQIFNDTCDVIALQNQEKSRNMMKYLADIASKLIPTWDLQQRGTF